jgi:hypothetical protein
VFLHDRVKSFDVQVYVKDGPDENEPVDEWGTDDRSEEIGVPARIEVTLRLELKPRILREQLRIVPLDRRTVTYRRVIRMPESLRNEELQAAVPKIPRPGTPGEEGGGMRGGGRRGEGEQQEGDPFDEAQRAQGGRGRPTDAQQTFENP